MLAIEVALIGAASRRRGAGCAVANRFAINEALAARPTLAGEQVALVIALTTSGNGVDVVAAAAGTGKTFSLDAARDVWQRCGYNVVGAALAARAAAELESGSGIRSTTVARLIADLDRPESDGLTRSTVLIVDEAAMVGTRTVNRVLAHAAAGGAKVVLVGDARVLPEVDAGGAFAGLARGLGPLTLRANRRQAEAWERAALASLRAGQVTEALDAYLAHDRVVSAPTADQARETLVADWWAAGIAGETTLLMAVRHADVDDLNGRARARMLLAGRLSGPILEVAGRPFQVGDRVMCRRNNIRLKVRNGTRGTVTDVDPATREISLATTAADASPFPPSTSTPGTSHTRMRRPSTRPREAPSTGRFSSATTTSTSSSATSPSHEGGAPTTSSAPSPKTATNAAAPTPTSATPTTRWSTPSAAVTPRPSPSTSHHPARRHSRN